MSAPRPVLELVKRFNDNIDSYKSGKYNETQLRREFIDPFFDALGWDVFNKQAWAEAYKEVIHEDAIKISGSTKAPDYSFRIGGVRKFFVETKKPAVHIFEDPDSAYQLRRYAWSAKLPLSILTDFEEFAVYDCRIKPDKGDRASTARVLYLTCRDYDKRWGEIFSVFSKDAVLKGSFDKYAESTKRKKGTAEVDEAFLEDIEEWRQSLAQNIALRNPRLSQRELNFAVGRTIDRIIFLRICEDRGIEQEGQLRALQNGTNIYQRLIEIYYRADEKYNSGLFHFREERGRYEPPDDLTLGLAIDDKPLKEIFKGLYYPESPYEFSVLPADILGHVYEQFLGKVIHLTPGHRARVEDKPEVKKAGGVYYTPTYIVDYIVKNTVGKLLEGKKPGPRGSASNIRVLDPACGSGSFLIGAYQHLLDWHRDRYVEDGPEKWAKGRNPALCQIIRGEWRLTTAERKRILLNSIYGVDIDPQAVEVTKLSLLLKVLEGESEQSLANQLRLFHERALPDLGNNVKCGNSLIGPDFYDNQQLGFFEDEERYRINVFDWKKEFPEIFISKSSSPPAGEGRGEGGFDAVIGNPPYIPIELMTDEQKNYYQQKYPLLERKYDSSIIFIVALLKKLKRNGKLGYISSLTWQTGENYAKLREYLFTRMGVVSLINLPFDVFKNAYVDTGVYILSVTLTDRYSIYRFPKKEKITDLNKIAFIEVPVSLVQGPDFKVVLEPRAQIMLSRLSHDRRFVPLGSFTLSTQGLAGNRFKLSDKSKEDHWFPFLEKGQVYRYVLAIEKISFTDMKDKATLKPFYETYPKILIRRVINRQDRLMATYTDEKLVYKKDINPFIITESHWSPLYVLGVLNSRLLSYFYINTSSIATKDDFRQTTLAELRRLPIPKLETDNARHDRMVELVETMLALHKKLAAAKTDHERTTLQRQIAAADNQIDRLVYELYGLTEDEIRIVEGADEDGSKKRY